MPETPDELGDEVRRLVRAVQDWAQRFPESGPVAARQTAGTECVPWCPICQFASVLRGEHPEVTERLAEAANTIATAMKALADAALTRTQSDAARRPRPRPTPRVEHIRLDDPAES